MVLPLSSCGGRAPWSVLNAVKPSFPGLVKDLESHLSDLAQDVELAGCLWLHCGWLFRRLDHLSVVFGDLQDAFALHCGDIATRGVQLFLDNSVQHEVRQRLENARVDPFHSLENTNLLAERLHEVVDEVKRGCSSDRLDHELDLADLFQLD